MLCDSCKEKPRLDNRRICRQCLQKQEYDYRTFTIEGKARVLYYRSKDRAKRKGMEFNLSQEWIMMQLSNGYCQLSGVEIRLTDIERDPYGPSLDRIDSSKGYTEDNTQLVCWGANVAKSTYDLDDILPILEGMVENLK